ncbi:uncharacterized protein ACMZJ9_011020 [Mantella aurantiaca]
MMAYQEFRQGRCKKLMVFLGLTAMGVLLHEICVHASTSHTGNRVIAEMSPLPSEARRQQRPTYATALRVKRGVEHIAAKAMANEGQGKIKLETSTSSGIKTLTMWYNSSNTHVVTLQFHMCLLTSCPSPGYWETMYTDGAAGYVCVTSDAWGDRCNSWGAVGWNTGDDWGYRPREALGRKDKNGKSLLTRMTILKTGKPCRPNAPTCNLQYVLTIENPGKQDEGKYVIATYRPVYKQFYWGYIRLRDMYQNKDYKATEEPSKPSFSILKAIADPTYEDTIAIETGYSDRNIWLEWTKYTAKQHNMTNCYVCVSARPHLGTVPLHIPLEHEECILSIFTNTTTSNDSTCESWKLAHPLAVTPRVPQVSVTTYKGNYTCYNGTNGGARVKNFPPGYCASYSAMESDKLMNQTTAMSDVYWLCGDLAIRQVLPKKWEGQCALAKLIMPIHMMGEREGKPTKEETTRRRREVQGPGGSLDPHVYIDAIGVPRGVPDEFKARNQVAAGFESLLPQVTINKNVNWINYIYYNQQRFVNYTRDAIAGLAAELGPNSKMTFQNRMALDMILAEKGGVCKMIGVSDTCCTFIPNNTGPTGKVTQALEELTVLSEELKRNSGIDSPWGSWVEDMFSSWQEALKMIGTILVCIVLVLSAIACCVVPLVRRMFNKTMVRDDTYIGLDGQNTTPCDETDNPPLRFD